MVRFIWVLILSLTILPSAAFAQAGSAGGSIGNDDKALSGARSAPPSDTRSTTSPSSTSAKEFDGTWIFKSAGSCLKKITTNVGKFVDGRLVDSVGDGSISPSGQYNYARGGKQPDIAVGKMVGNHGGGTWRDPNGKCHGTWTAERQ
jgi:hypothetical protein